MKLPKLTYAEINKFSIFNAKKVPIEIFLYILSFTLNDSGLYNILWPTRYEYNNRHTNTSCYCCGLMKKFWANSNGELISVKKRGNVYIELLCCCMDCFFHSYEISILGISNFKQEDEFLNEIELVTIET